MGNDPSRTPMMKKICWRLVDIVSAMLNASEREAVLGDLAESGERGGRALREVLGLVARRQAATWAAWRPWLTLTVLLIPLSIFLSVLSRSTSDESAVYAWMYANNWDWGLIKDRGFWYVLSDCAVLVFAKWLTLICWSWSAGFVLGYFSKGIARLNVVLLLFALGLGEAFVAPAYTAYSLNYLHRFLHLPALPNPNAPVSALTLYSAIFPIIIQVMLVAGPAIHSMGAGTQMAESRREARMFCLIAALLTIVTMISRTPGLGLLLHLDTHEKAFDLQAMTRFFKFVAYWPSLYFLAIAGRHRWMSRFATARFI